MAPKTPTRANSSPNQLHPRLNLEVQTGAHAPRLHLPRYATISWPTHPNVQADAIAAPAFPVEAPFPSPLLTIGRPLGPLGKYLGSGNHPAILFLQKDMHNHGKYVEVIGYDESAMVKTKLFQSRPTLWTAVNGILASKNYRCPQMSCTCFAEHTGSAGMSADNTG